MMKLKLNSVGCLLGISLITEKWSPLFAGGRGRGKRGEGKRGWGGEGVNRTLHQPSFLLREYIPAKLVYSC